MTIRYLYKNDPDAAAHLWDDGDTYCRQYSTGGLKKKRYKIHDDRGDRRVCKMCNDVFEKYSGYRITDVD